MGWVWNDSGKVGKKKKKKIAHLANLFWMQKYAIYDIFIQIVWITIR